MRKVKVTLNDKELEIRELRTRANAAWLRKLEGPLHDVVVGVASVVMTDLDDEEALSATLGKAVTMIPDVFDTVLDLLKEYAPEHAEDIEQCYSSEAVAALVEVIKLALPFGEVGKLSEELKALG